MPDMQYKLLRSSCIVPISGDASIPDTLGLPDDVLTKLRESVSVVINLASKTRLCDSFSTIRATNIDPALCVAELATTFPLLERFVWMSSAYANANLHWSDPDAAFTAVREEVYHLDSEDNPERELAEIEASGSSTAHQLNFFPSEYGYAKHLTERLLLSRFRGPSAGSRRLPHLLIVRPSCIGPALREPFPGFEVLGSTPITTYITYTIRESANGSGTHQLPHRNGTGFKTLVNECPVDLLANRLLAHTAHGSQDIIHAVVSKQNQLNLGDYWKEYVSAVPYALQPRIEWVDDARLLAQFQARTTGTSDEVFDLDFGPVPRAFTFLGASYMFGDLKTEELWKGMAEIEQEILPVMVEGKDELACALRTRKKRSPPHIEKELGRYGFFCSPEEEELGVYHGHLESDYLAEANMTGVGKAGDKCPTIKSVGGSSEGEHRFPKHRGVVGAVGGSHAGIVSEDVGALISGVLKRAVA